MRKIPRPLVALCVGLGLAALGPRSAPAQTLLHPPSPADPTRQPYELSRDAPLLIVLGQSNAEAMAAPMTRPDDLKACAPMTHVRGLSRAVHRSPALARVQWSPYSCFGHNLGADWNGGRAYHLAGLFARRWQQAIDSGTRLPDLHVIHIATSGQGFQQADGDLDHWWPGRNPADPDSLHPLALRTFALAVQDLQSRGKRVRVIGLHWNQWEAESMRRTISSADDARQKFHRQLVTFRAALGHAAFPIYLYRPRTDAFHAPTNALIREALVALASDRTTGQHYQLIDPADARDAAGRPLYDPAAAPGYGIFAPDHVHYTADVQRWFAQVQWDAVFRLQQHGTPISPR